MSGDGGPAAADVDRALRRLDVLLRRGRAQGRRSAAGLPLLPAQRRWTDPQSRGSSTTEDGRGTAVTDGRGTVAPDAEPTTAAVDEDVQSSASRVTKP